MNTEKLYLTAKTNTTSVEYEVYFSALSPDICYGFEDKKKFSMLCANGCCNFDKKWSCPPHSPSFRDYTRGWDNLVVLYFRIDLNQLGYIKNDYLKIKAANSILKSRSDRFLREASLGGKRFISSGSCRLCHPCKCKAGEKCTYPNKMAYSFEALGIDVTGLVERCFSTTLSWYRSRKLPQYTAVVCGLLTNEVPSIERMQSEYLRIITR